MADLWMDVDAALSEVPVNLMPLIDDTDFKSIEADVNYNATGLVLIWHFVTTAGAYTQTAVTPTDTGGSYDWVEQGNGLFTIEIPATDPGGGTIWNDTEGFGWFTGVATGILPWRGPVIGFRAAALNNAMIDGGDSLDVNLTQILGHTLTNTGTQIADAFQTMYDVSSPVLTAQSVNQTANNNTILAHADYGNAKLVRSTTPANKLDVSATGEAGLDFNNVKVATGATTLTNITVPTVTTVTNQLTAAAIATGIWQDTTAEDFTTSASIGKSLFTSGAVPGAAGGLFIAGTNAATIITTGLTTHFIGTVDTVTTYTGNTKQTADNNVILAHATYGLSALRTRGDLAWVTGAGTSTLDAAGVRAAVGLASANLDTQLADLPTVSEFNARSLVSADYFVVTDYTAPLDAAGIRTAVGLASANLDTQLGTITTAVGTTIPAALTTIAGYTDLIDDATSGLAKIASYIDTEIGTIVTAVGTTIPAHLTDIKGTGFVKDTDSLVNLGHIGADGDTLETLSDQMDVINGGAGAVTDTVTVYADDGSTPLDGAEVSATNDVAGVDGGVARARQYSDTNGQVTFNLNEGDYWIHVQQGGYMFTTTYPKKMTVSSTSFDWS